jgi:CRP-like cAMP-binding protein
MPHTKNLLLASLSRDDLSFLLPHLKLVPVKQHDILFEVGDKLPVSYFPLSAVVSLVVALHNGVTIEAAMVGRDGVLSASSALNGKKAFNRGVVQLGGDVMVCSAKNLKAAALQSDALLSKLMLHEQALLAQCQQSIACMAEHRVEPRLCRWLLRARDLARSDTLNFTQEYLAEMLGVRRTSVTAVARTLQDAGYIEYRRGTIKFINVDGMRQGACECYETVKANYADLLGGE